jgi:hypothetical protein
MYTKVIPMKIPLCIAFACLLSACGKDSGSYYEPVVIDTSAADIQCIQHTERPCSLSLGTPTYGPLRFRMERYEGSYHDFTGERTYTRIRDTSGGVYFEVREDGLLRRMNGSEPDSEYHGVTTLFMDSIRFYSLSGLRACTNPDEKREDIPFLLNGCVERTFSEDKTPPDPVKAYKTDQLVGIQAKDDSILYIRENWGVRNHERTTAIFYGQAGLLRFEFISGVYGSLDRYLIQLTRVEDSP